MGRPHKVGLEYFSLDVKMDDEVELIKAQHGMKGFGILITMYQTIYADKGYYREWNERNQILFSNKVSVDKNEVVSVIDDCIKWDIFDREKYNNYNILTSKRIQKQYVAATYKRTEIELYKEYLLLKEKEITRDNITCISVFDNENQDTSVVSDSKSTQSISIKDKDKELSIKDEENNLSDKSDEQLPVLSKLPRKNNNKRKYPEIFEEVWQEYPNRKGSNSKGGAYKKFRARINENISIEDLKKATINYKNYCVKEDNINTKFVMTAKTFFGPSDNWLEYLDYEEQDKITESEVL